jgi:hypothetical protein
MSELRNTGAVVLFEVRNEFLDVFTPRGSKGRSMLASSTLFLSARNSPKSVEWLFVEIGSGKFY